MRYLLSLILLLSLTLSVSAKKKEKVEKPAIETQTLYLIGTSMSFNDSIVYMTDVQPVEKAYLDKKFLGGAKEYSTQMDNYFTEKFQDKRINAVFFSTTRKSAEKIYVKLRKKFNKEGNEMKPLSTGEFTFKPISPAEE